MRIQSQHSGTITESSLIQLRTSAIQDEQDEQNDEYSDEESNIADQTSEISSSPVIVMSLKNKNISVPLNLSHFHPKKQ